MPTDTKQVLENRPLSLPASIDRATIVESLLASLDQPDPNIDAKLGDRG